jgi:hypothetical protein
VSPRGARTIRISGTRERLGRDPYRADLSGGRGTPRETPVALVQGGSVRHRGRDGVGVCTVNPPLPTRPLADSHARAKSERCSSRVLRRARAPLTRSALKSPNGTAAAERRGDCTHLFVSPRRGQAGRGGERAAARLAPPCEEHRPTRHRCHTVPGSSALSFALSLSLSLSLSLYCARASTLASLAEVTLAETTLVIVTRRNNQRTGFGRLLSHGRAIASRLHQPVPAPAAARLETAAAGDATCAPRYARC